MRRLGRLRADPERSFEELYRRNAPQIYRYAVALLDSPADAEEVTQTTFLNAYRAIQGGEQPRVPEAWLRTIALNLCRQRFRQATRRPSEVPLEEDVADAVPDEESPTLEDVTRALKHLPFSQRAALVMREFEGLSPREIAASLELSTSAVEALLFRARRSLREQLEGSLTCEEAERGLSLQLDGLLPRGERGLLRAHLRECPECARLARGMRAQRGAMKSLALLPIPSSLAWMSHGGGAAAAGGAAAGGRRGGGCGRGPRRGAAPRVARREARGRRARHDRRRGWRLRDVHHPSAACAHRPAHVSPSSRPVPPPATAGRATVVLPRTATMHAPRTAAGPPRGGSGARPNGRGRSRKTPATLAPGLTVAKPLVRALPPGQAKAKQPKQAPHARVPKVKHPKKAPHVKAPKVKPPQANGPKSPKGPAKGKTPLEPDPLAPEPITDPTPKRTR